MAQWLWIDSAGNKVFSDTAPPPGTPDKNILRKPGNRPEPKLSEPAAAPAVTGAGAAANAPASGAAPKPTGKDEQLEAKKKLADKLAEEAAQAKKKTEADQYAKARAENCERAKRAKATLDAGTRLSTTNAKGEREIMDDKARAAEAKRADDVVRSDCGPMPAAATPSGSAQAKP